MLHHNCATKVILMYISSIHHLWSSLRTRGVWFANAKLYVWACVSCVSCEYVFHIFGTVITLTTSDIDHINLTEYPEMHIWIYPNSEPYSQNTGFNLHQDQEGILCQLCGVMLTYISSQLCRISYHMAIRAHYHIWMHVFLWKIEFQSRFVFDLSASSFPKSYF